MHKSANAMEFERSKLDYFIASTLRLCYDSHLASFPDSPPYAIMRIRSEHTAGRPNEFVFNMASQLGT